MILLSISNIDVTLMQFVAGSQPMNALAFVVDTNRVMVLREVYFY
jgi:hypothetical protein